MASKRQEFYMSVKAILDKTQAKKDAVELQELLSQTKINFDTPEFEDKVRAIVQKMSKETMSVIGQSFNEALKLLGKEQINLDSLIQMPNADMWKEMGKVAGQFYGEGLQEAVKKALEGIDLSALSGQKRTNTKMKNISEIDQAISRLKNKNGSFSKGKVKQIQGGFHVSPQKGQKALANQIEKVQQDYSSDSEWEIKYVSLLKYIKLYEYYQEKFAKVPQELSSIGKLTYRQAKSLEPQLQTSLQNIFNVATGKQAIGLTEGGAVDVNVAPRVIETLDIYDVLGGKEKIEVPVKVKVETDDKSTDVKTVDGEKKLTFKAYRAIGSAEGKTKKDVFEDYGAEYWATTKKTAPSYADNHYGKSSMLVGTVKSVNPLIFDAKGALWDDFKSIEGFIQVFPEVEQMLEQPHVDGADIQKYTNEQARLAGFDSVIVQHVQDTFDADKQEDVLITDTIAVLDDRIVSLLGAFDELEGQVDKQGHKKFSQTMSDVPEYYETSESFTSEQYVANLREQQQKSSQFWTSQISRLQSDLDKAEQEVDIAQQELEKDPKSPIKKEHVEQAKEEVARLNAIVEMFNQNMSTNQKNIGAQIAYYEDLIERQKNLVGENSTIDDANNVNKTIQSYEELCDVVKRYNELILKSKTEGQDFTDADREELNSLNNRIQATRDLIASDDVVNEINAFDRTQTALGTTTPEKLAHYLGIEIPEAAQKAQEGIDGVNSSIETNNQLDNVNNSAQNVAENNEETDSIKRQNEELKENISLKEQQSHSNQSTPNTTSEANTSNDTPVGKVAIDETALKSILDSITYKVQIVGDSESSEQGVTAISEESLKTILSSVTFNVQSSSGVEGDDIGISQTQVSENVDEDSSQAPWAKENTLNGEIKTILGDIKTNTALDENNKLEASLGEDTVAKLTEAIGKINITSDLTTEGLATQDTVSGIADLVKSINDKIVQGTRIVEKDSGKTTSNNSNNTQTQSEGTGADDSLSIEKKALELLKEEYRLKTEIFNLEQKGATKNDLNPLYEKLGICQSIRNIIEDGMDDEALTKYAVQAAAIQGKGEDKLTVADIKSNIKARAEEAKKAAQSVKEEEKQKADALKELKKLYGELGTLQAKKQASERGSSVATELRTQIKAKKAEIAEKQADHNISQQLLEDERQLSCEKEKSSIAIQEATNKDTTAAKEESTKVKELKKLYEDLGTYQAILDTSDDGSYIAQDAQFNIDRLKEEITVKKEKVKISEEELQQIYQIAKAEKQRAIASQQSKQADKNALKEKIKQSREDARFNRADSVLNTGTVTIESLWKIDDNSIDVSQIDAVKQLNNALNALRNTRDKIAQQGGAVDPNDASLLQDQIKNVAKLSAQVKELIQNYEQLSGENVVNIGELGTGKIQDQLKTAVQEFTQGKAIIGEFDAETNTLKYTVKTGAHEFTNYTAAIRSADKVLVSVQGTTKHTETFLEASVRKMKEISSYISGMGLISRGIQEVRQGITYVREIDSALTELKKVTDETEESYDRFLNTASKTADKVGSTIKEIVSSTADWARLNKLGLLYGDI